MGSRSRRLIQESRALIEKSRASVARTRRRIIHAIRGGSSEIVTSQSPKIETPRIWAGPADGSTRCAICANAIPNGSVEYELISATGSIVVDRNCLVLWQNVLSRLERRR